MNHSVAGKNDVPFCQQNVRLWVMVLLVSAVVVLGIAFYLAFEDGRFTGFGRQANRAAGQAAVAASARVKAAPPASQTRAPQPQAATPVAFRRPCRTMPAVAAAQAPAVGNELAPGSFQRVAQRTTPNVARQLQATFNQVADKVRPFVVNINAVRPSRNVAANGANNPRFIDPFDGIPDKIIGQLAYESVGSGVIIDPTGYVVTNDHLISGAVSIVVTRFNSKEHLRARLVATDRRNDLAVLKLEGPGPYPAAKLANSDKVDTGDWVLAVGNPFGLGHTVTSGIVSSRRSAIVISGVQYRDLLQTDAPINQGSSGGPLVDLNGKVVGINTAIYAPTGVFNGTGFAIPSNRVGAFVARVMQDPQAARSREVGRGRPGRIFQVAGGAARPWIGLGVSDVTPELANKLGMPRTTGVFVNSVERGSPAAEGEIRRGDVVVALAGQPVYDSRSLAALLSALPPGQKVPLVIWRKGRAKARKVRLLTRRR